MGTIAQGGFLSEAYVFPLHKLSEISIDDNNANTNDNHNNIMMLNDNNGMISLPNDGGLTIYDNIIGSMISGTKEEYDRLISILLYKLEKNVVVSLQQLKKQNPNIFYFNSFEITTSFFNTKKDNNDNNGSGGNSDSSICHDAENKFIIRFHSNDLKTYGYDDTHRTSLVKDWMEHYKNVCWDTNDPKKDENDTSSSKPKVHLKTSSSSLIPHEYLTIPNEVELIDESKTISEVSCDNDNISCVIKKTCISSKNGIIKLFGTPEDVEKNKKKLMNVVTQNIICENCKMRHLSIEHGVGVHNIVSKIATFTSGIDINDDCNSLIGDMVWPLIRLNLKFRTIEDVQDQGLGYLFLEAPISTCDSTLNKISDQIIRISSMTEESDICVENLYLGTKHMNYMPYSFFLPLYNDFERDMKIMRLMFWKNYGITINEKTKQPIVPMDTVLIAHGKNIGGGDVESLLKYNDIGNISEITNMIRTEFPSYKLNIISLEDYSMKQQVRIMARVKLMISLSGSSMNSFLFQDEATLFSYCTKGEDSSATDVLDTSVYSSPDGDGDNNLQRNNEIKLWFKHFDYGNYYEFCDNEDMFLNEQDDTIINVTKLSERMHKYGF